MPTLGVNIDHVATIRQARRTVEPDPVAAAVLAELAGADGITVHLREDRRHIQDRDVRLLRQTVRTHLNLEMAATDEMVAIALDLKPDYVTLVPERREEVTTEGGLDIAGQVDRMKGVVDRLQGRGFRSACLLMPMRPRLKHRLRSRRSLSSCTPAPMPKLTRRPIAIANWPSSAKARPRP